MILEDLASRRFLFVTGKGGVGKTTVCAAHALALAAIGKRVLIAMCGPHERLSSILGTAPIGHPVQWLSDNVWATKIEPDRAQVEYGELVLKVKSVARAVFDNRYTTSFLRAVPGLTDWALLGKAWWHTTETLEDGSLKYDVVMFDAPSTGHGLDLLRVPRVICEIVPPGVLRRDAERAWAMFQDPAQSGVLLVTLPEELPVTETIELYTALATDLKLPVPRLIVNAVHEPIFSSDEREALMADEALLDVMVDRPDPSEAVLSAAARRATREHSEARAVARLTSELQLKTIVLPFLLDGAGTPEGARRLAARL